jgi:hypothetical protein
MRRLLPLLVLMLGACGSGNPAPQARQPQNVARPLPAAPEPQVPEPQVNAAQAAPDDVPPRDDAGVAGLSPAQRRAWELGYRDCSHGRYAPDNHLEAYRIGCGAAHDRIEDGRPQG